MSGIVMQRMKIAKLVILGLFVAFFIATLFINRTAKAYSSGPPAGYTRAPGEEPEACAECHLQDPNNPGTGRITVTVPQTYVPGQTYQITVTSTNSDPTRLRWGFQLTALDDLDSKAGNLQPLDVRTQVLDNQGPGGSRQYIEHTSSGTFINQQGGASWTFNWAAPATNVGPVTFYVAGNQANNDGNTSGDYIYFTFAQTQAAAVMSDFQLTATPPTQTIAPGNNADYNLMLTPSSGFTGQVALSITGLPAGASAVFNPSSVNITDATAKSSTLSVMTSGSTPVGTYPLTINAISGSLQHTAIVSLKIVSSTSADLSLTKTGSPNPAVVGTSLSYRITATNNGPASATNVNVTDTLPANVTFASSSTTQGSCVGAGTINCNLGALSNGASAVVTINVTPNAAGQITNTASVTGTEADPDTNNNTATVSTIVDPQVAAPLVLDQNLSVKTIASGFDQPTSMAFLSANEFLILERATGKVQRVVNGQLQATAVDLAVNNASERGLLGIALHPNFPATPYVYLYWTESSTNVDTSNIDEVPLLGNRVDRFVWNGATLTLDRNLIHLRALQADAGQSARGNHNGGVLRFGPDGKLFIFMGDNGRRGLLQNVTSGGTVPDDQFGGPEPDDAHLTGVILRLNDDGSTPPDNPFFNANAGLTGEAAANIKKIYAYGVRNSFGMAFDPQSGNLWTQENGDDAFDEINRVTPGFNGGWIQVIGPSSRIAQYKSIEVNRPGGLQQNRWSPTLIADTPAQALSRLYSLPGSQYREPEFSWKYAVAPSPIGFVKGKSLGAQFEGDLFVGASRTTLYNGYLFRLRLSSDRLKISMSDPRLADTVADNLDKFDITESESLLIGKNFGVTTDIQTGPDGNLYVVSLSNGTVYQIFAANSLQLSASSYTVGEGIGGAQIVITRTGNTSGAVTIDYATTDNSGLDDCSAVNGQANSRCDYLATTGTLHFDAGVTSKIINIPIVDDARVEGTERLAISLSNPGGASLGPVSTATIFITDNGNDSANAANPIDDNNFFIRQHYLDFLDREPESAGFTYWTDILKGCGTNAACLNPVRVEISSRFFIETEFQRTGFFVMRLYKASYGTAPTYAQFIADRRQVENSTVGQKQFANIWVNRTAFITEYPATLTAQQFVTKLFDRAGVADTTARAAAVQALINNPNSRDAVIFDLVETPSFQSREYNPAFVKMQYFGYLRRDADPVGEAFWNNVLATHPDNYRGMICAFVNSNEYQLRFNSTRGRFTELDCGW